MKVTIETIPHQSQRYDTVGDWSFNQSGDLRISVSDMGDWRYEMLVGYHELAEALMCKDKEISEQQVTDFDTRFEEMRKTFPDLIGSAEPGFARSAPYKIQHANASSLERKLSHYLEINWAEYEKAIDNLKYHE